MAASRVSLKRAKAALWAFHALPFDKFIAFATAARVPVLPDKLAIGEDGATQGGTSAMLAPGIDAAAISANFCSTVQTRRRSIPEMTVTWLIAPSLTPVQTPSLAPPLRPTTRKNRQGGPQRRASAKLPVVKDIDAFVFDGTPVNEGLVRALHGGSLLSAKRNIVLVGGTGTGKAHLAIAITASVVRAGARGRYVNTVNLVTRLEEETRIGKAGALAARLGRLDLVVLDELGLNRPGIAGGH